MKRLICLVLTVALLLLANMVAFAEEPITLELWHSLDANDAAALNAVITAYDDAHPEVNIVCTYLPGDDMQKAYVLGANTGDLPDVGFVDGPKVTTLIVMDAMIDITDRIESDGLIDGFYPGPLQAVTWEGRIYGMPHTSNCLALFYDADQLAEVGCEPPKTWDDLLTVCGKLKDAGHENSLAISMRAGEEGMFQYVPWLYTAGADIYSLDGEKGIECVSFLKQLVDDGYMSKDVINWGQGDCINQFKSGNVVMNINGSWNVGDLRTNAPDKNWGVVPMPTLNETPSTSVLGGETFCLMNKAGEQHIDEAYELIKYLCCGEGCLEFCKASGRTPNRGEIMEQLPEVMNDEILSVFAKGLETAVSRGPSPRWPEISDAVMIAVHKVLTDQEDAQTAMAEAQEVVNGIMTQ